MTLLILRCASRLNFVRETFTHPPPLFLIVSTEAMDRIHRLGQHRPVEAIKLVVEDSIESRIVQVRTQASFSVSVATHHQQLQEKKSAMVDATLSTDDSVSLPFFCSYIIPLIFRCRLWEG